MHRTRRAVALIPLVLLLTAFAWAAGRWDAPAADLAQRILAAGGPGTATIQVRNVSALTPDQVSAVRRVIEQQLRAGGVRLSQTQNAAIVIRVTLSENPRGWLWIGEVQQGSETRVVMVEIPAERSLEQPKGAAAFTLRSSLLLHSPEPLLDVEETPGGLVGLTPTAVLVRPQAGERPAQQLPLPETLTLPRDPRGRLAVDGDKLEVFLPGMVCSTPLGMPSLDCRASDDPWPLGGHSAFYDAARNYFTGVLVPGFRESVPPFFNAASLTRGNYTYWFFTGIEGQVFVSDGRNMRRLGGEARGWGSEIAAVHSGCGAGTQLLVGISSNENGNGDANDALQAYELGEHEPVAVSGPLALTGTLTALWPAQNSASATAIVRTAQGGYDAYSITLACAP